MVPESSRVLSANKLSLDKYEFIQSTHMEWIYFINTEYVLNRYFKNLTSYMHQIQ